MTSPIALCTTTFYDTSEEGVLRKKLATEFARDVVEHGYKLFVVDGGTDNGNFIEQLKRIGADAYPETQRGLGPSRREVLGYAQQWARANNVLVMGWSEPEKVGFVPSIRRLIDIVNAGADLVVPARKNMVSYPVAQEHSEQFANQLHTDAGYVDARGQALDTFFGPKLWHANVTPFFSVFGHKGANIATELAEMRMERAQRTYKDAAGDGLGLRFMQAGQDLIKTDHMMHMPTCLMVKKNGTAFGKSPVRHFNIVSVDVDYAHPAEQTELEQRLQARFNQKRLMQLNAIAEQYELVKRLHEKGTLDNTLDEMLVAEGR